MTLILSGGDVALLAEQSLLLEAADAALVAMSDGTAQVPQRMKLQLVGTENRLLVMPAHLPDDGALATKVITVSPQNSARGRPLIGGIVVLTNPTNGDVLAIIDAASLTGLRTAAASAIATRALARPDAKVLGVIGAGVQGRAHVGAMSHLYNLSEVRLCSRRGESAEDAVRELSPLVPGELRAVATPYEAGRDADIIVTATTAATPVLHGRWVNEGAHICAVGSAAPTIRELDTDLIRRAAVIATDTRSGALAEAGDFMIPIDEGQVSAERVVEVGEVLLDPTKGRRSDTDITVFKGVGSAALDVAVAMRLYERAVDRGVGTEIPLVHPVD